MGISNEITVADKVIGSGQYGNDYLAEFRRVLETHTKLQTGNFLEWGAGHTTLEIAQFCERSGGNLFLTIDDNQSYLTSVVAPLKDKAFLRAEALDLKGPCVDQKDTGLNYATQPLALGIKFDFIFIDGRRRLECAYSAALMCHQDTVVVIHDYRRSRYQPVKLLYDIVEDGTQFRVMKPRKSIFNQILSIAPEIASSMAPSE